LKHISVNGNTSYDSAENWKNLGDYNIITNSKGAGKEFLFIESITQDSVHVTFKLDLENVRPRVIFKFKKYKEGWFLVEETEYSVQ
jgi:hypothetical protein